MDPLIEYCEQNLAKGSQLVLDDPFIEANSDSVTYSCVNECALCAQTFYVLFEGERLVGETPEQLLEVVKQHIIDWQNDTMDDL